MWNKITNTVIAASLSVIAIFTMALFGFFVSEKEPESYFYNVTLEATGIIGDYMHDVDDLYHDYQYYTYSYYGVQREVFEFEMKAELLSWEYVNLETDIETHVNYIYEEAMKDGGTTISKYIYGNNLFNDTTYIDKAKVLYDFTITEI